MHPDSHMHICTHAGRHTPSTPNRWQVHAGTAHRDTHMLSLDTNLAGELATTWEERKSKRRWIVRVGILLGKLGGRDHLQTGREGGGTGEPQFLRRKK